MSASLAYDSDNDDEIPTLVQVRNDTTTKSALPQTHNNDSCSNPCPVSILCGFLGSGKTTLIQYILKQDHGKRIAVIENEYGEGLQVESLIARDGVNDTNLTDLIELPNGCICCTVKDSLVATLENLLEKRQDLDYILIECSGMAEPGPIASLFWLDEALESRLRLDGIVCMVDALHIERQLSTTLEAAQQVAYSDRILLNKIDLIADSSVDGLLHRLHRINPTAPIQCTKFSAVPDLDWILDAQCFDPERLVQDEPANIINHNHSHDHDDPDCAACAAASKDHQHTDHVMTISLVETGNVNLERVDKWLAALLWPNQDESNQILCEMLESPNAPLHKNNINTPQIFRIKGVLAVPDDKRRHIVQAVYDLWEIHPASDALQWKPDEERVCKLVVIGRFLAKDEVRQGFLSCFV